MLTYVIEMAEQLNIMSSVKLSGFDPSFKRPARQAKLKKSFDTAKQSVCGLTWLVGWLFGFYGISTFVGYLMSNPFLYK